MNGVVLAVHGKQFHVGLPGGGHHNFTGRDEDFFVGESDALPGLDGGVCSFKTHNAHNPHGNQRLGQPGESPTAIVQAEPC